MRQSGDGEGETGKEEERSWRDGGDERCGRVQQKGDDAGDAKQEWRDGRERLERQRDAAQRGQLELTEMIPRSGHSSQKTPGLCTGESSRCQGRGSRSWEGDRSPHCLPLPLPRGGSAHPCPSLPAQPGSPGVSPQHRGVPPGCQAAPEPPGPHRALELLHPRQPLRHHHVAQGKSPCNIKIHPESLQMQIKPITGKNTLGRPENK